METDININSENTENPGNPAIQAQEAPTIPSLVQKRGPGRPRKDGSPPIQSEKTKKKLGRPPAKRMNLMQQRYVAAIVSGEAKSKHNAATIAGYSHGTVPANIEKSELVKNALQKAMMKAGISEEYLANKIKEGLNATTKKFFAFEGRVQDERTVNDYDVREKYLKDSLEVLGFIRNNSIENMNIGLISLPQNATDENWEQIVGELTGATIPDATQAQVAA